MWTILFHKRRPPEVLNDEKRPLVLGGLLSWVNAALPYCGAPSMAKERNFAYLSPISRSFFRTPGHFAKPALFPCCPTPGRRRASVPRHQTQLFASR